MPSKAGSRQRADEPLESHSGLLPAHIAEVAHDAIFLLDPNGTIQFWNRGAERLYGWKSAQALGQNAHQLLATKFPVSLQACIDAVRNTGDWLGELVHTTATGAEVIVNSRWNAQLDGAGRFVGTLEINRDITEEKRALAALKRAEQTLQLALSSADAWYWEFNMSTKRFTRSRDISGVYGLPPGSVGDTMEEVQKIVHPEDRERIKEEIRRAAEEHREFNFEYRAPRPDRSIRWIWVRGRVLPETPPRYVGIAVDITERKMAEQTLRNTEKLAATGRLAATIAHEINNPLEAISGAMFLLERKQNLDGDERELLSMARNQLERVSNIVQHTLGMHRESSIPADVNVCSLIDDALLLFAKSLSRRGISIEKDFDNTCSVVGFGDELRQVFSNLIGNAIDAMEDGGVLKIKIRQTHGGVEWRRSGVRVTVADTGTGIPVDSRRQLFQPLFTTKGSQGTGLGLWVSRSFVEKHGGIIRFRSATRPEMHGTVFEVFIPHSGHSPASER